MAVNPFDLGMTRMPLFPPNSVGPLQPLSQSDLSAATGDAPALAPAPMVQAPGDPEGAYHNYGNDGFSLARAAQSSAEDFGSMFPILGGAAANLVKPGLGDSMVNYGLGMKRRAAELTSDVPTLGNIHGIGDAAEWLGNTAIHLAPDLALMALTGGVGEAAARGVAAKAAGKIAAEAADRAGARYAVSKAGQEAAAAGADFGMAPDAAKLAVARTAAERALPRTTTVANRVVAGRASDVLAPAGRYVGTGAGLYPQTFSDMAAPQLDEQGNPIPGTGLVGADRETNLKYALGAIPAALAGAAPEFRAFGLVGKMFSKTAPEATGEIAANAQKLLPRLLKEGAVQGGLGGTAAAVQSALEMGTHQWVNDNASAMSPQALHTYMEAFANGGVLGALTGAGLEGAKGAAQALAGGARRGLAAAKQGAAAAKTAYDAKAAPYAAKVADVMRNNVNAVRARFGSEAAPESADFVGAPGEAPIDARVGAAPIEDRELPKGNAAYPDSSKPNPYRLNTDLQDVVGRFVRADTQGNARSAPLWFRGSDRNTDQMNVLTASAAKLLRGQSFDSLPDADKANIETLVPHLNDGWNTVKLLEQAGHARWAKAYEDTKAASAEPANDVGAAFDDMQSSMAEAAMHAVNTGADLRTAAEDVLAKHETSDVSELPETPGVESTLGAQVVPGLPRMTTAQRLDATIKGSPERAALQQQLRNEIYQKGGAKTGRTDADGNPTVGPLTQNDSSPAAKAQWAKKDPLTHANTIEIEPRAEGKTASGKPIRQALQLDNLVSAKLAEPENKGIGPKAAMMQVLSDVQSAGHTINPKSITPGVFYTNKEGTIRESLSPNETLAIRYGLRTPAERGAKKPSAEFKREAAAYFKLRGKLGIDAEIPRLEPTQRGVDDAATTGADTPTQATSKADTQVGAGDSRIDDTAFVDRTPPPGSPREITSEGGVAGAATGSVRDVHLRQSPYEELVNRARRAVTALPKERARIAHEAGVEIGTKELSKERENGTISDKRHASELKRLSDYSSGLSRKYLNDAVNGKFDSGNVSEVPPDKAEPTNSRRETVARMRAAARELGLDPNDPSSVAGAVRKFIEEGVDKLTPKQSELVNAARDASHYFSESSPLREAFDTRKPVEPQLNAEKKSPPNAVSDLELPGKGGKTLANVIAATGEKSPRTHKQLTDASNAVLERLGIKDKVQVRIGGVSQHGGRLEGDTIRLGRNLKGDERTVVLSHELGHHVMRSELARTMSTDGKTVSAANLANHTVDELYGKWNEATQQLEGGLLGQHNPEFQKALSEDFAKFRAEHDVVGDPKVGETRLARATAQRAEGLAARAKSPESLPASKHADPEGERAYLGNIDEYFADHFARALTHTAPEGKIGAFFKSVAQKLKLLYDTLFTGKGGEKYAAAPSVQKWVDDLFDRTRVDVSAKLGESVTVEQAKTAVEAAAASANYGVPNVSGVETGGVLPGRETLRPIIDFIKNHLGAPERARLQRTVDSVLMHKRLSELFGSSDYLTSEINSTKRGMETRQALAYLAYKDGMLKEVAGVKVSPLTTIKSALSDIAGIATDGTYARRIFDDMASGRAEQIVREQGKYENLRVRFEKERGQKQKVFNDLADKWNAVNEVRRKLFSSVVSRIERTAVPALNEVRSLIHLHTGESGKNRGYASTVVHATDQWARKYTDIVNSLSPTELKHAFAWMQRNQGDANAEPHFNPKVRDAVTALNKYFADAAKYSQSAGAEHGVIDNYLPVVLDLKSDADAAKLRTIVSDPRLRDGLYRSMGEDPKKATDEKTTELIDKQVKYAQDQSPSKQGIPDDATTYAGVFRGERQRLMQYVYDAKDPKLNEAFEALQTKDPSVVLQRYVLPMVKRAESVRYFGKDDARLNKLLDKAKQQGASDADIQLARDAADAARGKFGLGGSPVLRKLLGPNLANKIANPQSKRVMQAMQVYQNIRLLPLITLSSLMDPLAIGIRTGGDVGATFRGIKTGVHAIFSKAKRADMQAALDRLGSSSDRFVSEINDARFGGGGQGTAHALNNIAMKAYMIEQWTRITRGMALDAAHKFLLDNKAMDTDRATRFLRTELNLRQGDVAEDPTNKGYVKLLTDEEAARATPIQRAADTRVKNALMRVIDESIIRPNSQMSPLWMSDPYMGLISQYKTFAYAMFNQVGERLMHELANGNYSVVAPALAYLPVIVMQEMLRGMIQYGPGGDPKRREWGLHEWSTLALNKSGFVEPNIGVLESFHHDRAMGAPPGASLLGPTYQQTVEAGRFLGGGESTGRFLLHSAPAEPLFSHWFGSAVPSAGMSRRT